MAQVQDFHNAPVFTEPVINQNRTVQQLAHSRPFADCAAHAGETSQQLDVVEQGATKARGSLAVIFGNMADDGRKIA